MTNGPSVEAVALASKAYEDAPCDEDAGEWHDWVNETARAIDAHTEAIRTRLAACEEALVQARGALLLDHMVQDNGAPYGTTVVALDAIDAALKEPSRGK